MFCACSLAAQTVTLNDAKVIGANARAGVSTGMPSGSDPVLKNLLGYSNPGFEPMVMQQMLQFQGTNSHSSTTSFQWDVNNTVYESYDQNQWANATFTVVQGSYASGNADPALGCTGSIASSTNQRDTGPIFAVNPATNQGSDGCAGSLGLAGQLIILSTNDKMPNVFPTPATTWSGKGGNNGSIFSFGGSGGARVTSNTTDLCPACGTQSLNLAVPAGGLLRMLASSQFSGPAEKSILLSGTYTISFWAKSSAATPPAVSLVAVPRSGSNCSKTFSAASTPAISATWTQFSAVCAFSETVASPNYPFTLQITVSADSGAATNLLFDNISMTNSGDTNPTVFNDAYVAGLKALCQTAENTTGPGCTLRLYAPSPEAETVANWVLPTFQHRPEITNAGAISNAYSQDAIGIFDFLYLCQYIHATPVLNIPITMTTADAANLVDYLEGGPSAPFGATRIAQGQAVPWVGDPSSPFSTIYIEFGNENWNPGFLGNAIGFNSSAPSNPLYYDYALRAQAVFAAARERQTAQSYSQTATKWILGLQTASRGDGGALGIARADGAEINGYTADDTESVSAEGCTGSQASVASCPLYGPALTEPYANTHDPASEGGFHQSLAAIDADNNCGPSGKAKCLVMVYEQNNGTGNGSTKGPFTQTVADSFVEAGVQGVITADQLGENDAAGVVNQNLYQALQYYFGEAGIDVHIWGIMIDAGGDCSLTNSKLFGGSFCPRPQMLGAMVYNWCKIGPMVQTTWTGDPIYNLSANKNGVHELHHVPILKSFAFASSNKRCMVMVNSDVSESYTVRFSGTNAPASGVTTYQFATPELNSVNEAPALTPTGAVVATMSNTMTKDVDVTSGYKVPPHSVTAFAWTIAGASSKNKTASPDTEKPE